MQFLTTQENLEVNALLNDLDDLDKIRYFRIKHVYTNNFEIAKEKIKPVFSGISVRINKFVKNIMN